MEHNFSEHIHESDQLRTLKLLHNSCQDLIGFVVFHSSLLFGAYIKCILWKPMNLDAQE
jgi:hypothetical protein